MTHDEVKLIMESVDSIANSLVAAEVCDQAGRFTKAKAHRYRAAETRKKLQWLLETMIDDV